MNESNNNNKPKEFWVFKGDSNFCNELEFDSTAEHYTDDELVRSRPDGFYDIVSTKDTVEGGIHVIDYSAFQKCVDTLKKIADPRLRDHKEPDAYTQLGCVMHMAEETLREIGVSDD